MSERKLKGQFFSVLLSIIFVFTTIFGAGSISAWAEETDEATVTQEADEQNASLKQNTHESFKLIIRTKAAYDKLYFAPYYKGGLTLAKGDSNTYGEFFWNQEQAELAPINDDKNLFEINLRILNPSIEDGFGIYTSTSSEKNDRIIDIWGGEIYATLISGTNESYVFDEETFKVYNSLDDIQKPEDDEKQSSTGDTGESEDPDDTGDTEESEDTGETKTPEITDLPASDITRVFIKAPKDIDTLYVITYKNCTLHFAKDDTNDYDTVFSANWGQEQAVLKEIKSGSGIFRLDFKVDTTSVVEGFGIYSADSGADNVKLANCWQDDLFRTIIKSVGKNIVLDISKNPGKDNRGTVSENLSSYGITDELIRATTTEVQPETPDPEPSTDPDPSEVTATDIIRGADLSSYLSIQQSFDQMNADKYQGRTDWGFKDFDGNIIKNQDFFNFLARQGMNWVRIRIWNDPYDAAGNGYGGGTNDVKKAVTMGQWATNAGMKVLIDFHYSDSWADPSRQTAPKAWKDYNGDPDKTAQAVADFTTASLNTLLDAGVNVGMVQVGNETNNGIAGVKASGDWTQNVDKIYAAGCDAVHAAAEAHNIQILAAVHFADPQKGNYPTYAANLAKGNVDYDVFASSAYPFWHGGADSVKSRLTAIAQQYHKQVMVAETSYPYTLDEIDGFDDNTVSRQKNNTVLDGEKYPYSQDGQAREFRTLANAVSSINYKSGQKAGLGAFYWEGAWNGLIDVRNMSADEKAEAVAYEETLWSKYGSGWSSKYASEYDVEAPKDGKSGGAVIENQSFFGPNGTALNSLRAFAEDYDPSSETIKDTSKVVKIEADSTVVELSNNDTLTSDMLGNAAVYYASGAQEDIPVEWDASQIAQINEQARDAANDGNEYTVDGTTTTGDKTSRKVRLFYNYINNGSFETGDSTGWSVKDGSTGGSYNDKDNATNTYNGKASLHFYYDDKVSGEYEISQNVKIAKPGIYSLSMVTHGVLNGTDDGLYLKYELNGSEKEVTDIPGGWKAWHFPTISDITVTQDMIDSGKNEITVIVGIKGSNGSWGNIDDIRLVRTGEISAPVTPSETPTTPTVTPSVTPTAPSETPSVTPEAPSVTPTTPTVTPSATPTTPTVTPSEPQTVPTETPTVTPSETPSVTPTDNTTGDTEKKDKKKYTIEKNGKSSGKIVDNKGKTVKNKIVTISGRKYYADKKGRIVKNKLIKVKGKKYITDSKGRIITGKWVKRGKKKYYCSKSGKITKTKKLR